MKIKLFDSELKIMETIWREGELPAKKISDILKEEIGWNINTTYTVIKKCIEKGALARSEPNFICKALITKEQVREQELDEFINKMFNGSDSLLFASLLSRKNLPDDIIENLKNIVKQSEAKKSKSK